jgi:hypothetical protein
MYKSNSFLIALILGLASSITVSAEECHFSESGPSNSYEDCECAHEGISALPDGKVAQDIATLWHSARNGAPNLGGATVINIADEDNGFFNLTVRGYMRAYCVPRKPFVAVVRKLHGSSRYTAAEIEALLRNEIAKSSSLTD